MATADQRPSSERILHKALELFSRRGYQATSVREICESAGITKPTLYHFYGSKEGVYRALVEGALVNFQRSIERALGTPGPADSRLKAVARAYFGAASRQPELTRFILALVHNPSSSAPVTDFPRFYEQTVALVAASVDEAVKRGELAPGPTELRMLTFMGALGEAMCACLIGGEPALTDALADGLVDTILSSWTPSS